MTRPPRLYAHRYGEGPTCALALHGWAGAHHTYEAAAPWLPSGQTLLSLDMPGYGQSDDPPAWTLEAITAQLAEGLERDGLWPQEPCTLVGNCSGAVVALLLAKAQPERFSRLILVEPFAYAPWYFKIFLLPLLGRFFYWNAFQNPLGRWLADLAMRDQAGEGRDLMEGFTQTRARTALGYLAPLAAMRAPEQFAALPMPIEVVFGSKTLAAVKASVLTWRRVWPHARVHEVEGAGHLLLQEKPSVLGGLL